MQIEYSPTAGALYLRLAAGDVSDTIEIEPEIYVDIDQRGDALGIEFVDAGAFLPFIQRHGGNLNLPSDLTAFAGARRLAS